MATPGAVAACGQGRVAVWPCVAMCGQCVAGEQPVWPVCGHFLEVLTYTLTCVGVAVTLTLVGGGHTATRLCRVHARTYVGVALPFTSNTRSNGAIRAPRAYVYGGAVCGRVATRIGGLKWRCGREVC